MKNPALLFAVTAVTLATVASLAACTVTPARVVVREPAVVVMAPVAPPPPRYEFISVAPSHYPVWIPGYWHWQGNQHRWIDGRWEQRREHEQWVAHHWDRDDRGQWRLSEGHWRHD